MYYGHGLDTVRYWLGLFVVIGLPPGIAWWYLIHPAVGFWRRLGPRLTMTVMTIFLLSGIIGLYAARTVVMGSDLGFNPILATTGVALTIGGFALAFWRRKYLTTRILVGIPEVQTDPDKRGDLLDRGPYAVVRHPRYVEVVLVTFGYAAIANWTGPWIIAVLMIPTLHLVVLLEERELAGRFGDTYRAYATRVPRYIPTWKTSPRSRSDARR